uniref:Uncharacterized protein n=1 Tax=viral metagenome TaxID=1070528 RepID=A0A6C0BT08_9ZZZZ
MDLNQTKLTKSEWNSVERPVDKDEMKIIKLIIKGFYNTEIKYNENLSLISFIKISDVNDAMHYHLFTIHFVPLIESLIKKYNIDYTIPSKPKSCNTLKKSDSFKIENKDKEYISNNCHTIFDFTIIEVITHILKNRKKKLPQWQYFYYTLSQMKIQTIEGVNTFVIEFQNYILDSYLSEMKIESIIENSQEYIEKNQCLIHYSDIKLYGHQQQLFNIFNKDKVSNRNLVLYIAPTATGKTLSPLGLSEKYKIIFVCAARHVGIALSKSAISAGKKIAFAFGCNDASEIRLHYSAAASYVKHHKTGQDIKYKDGNKKVDNSDGSKVEIIICDLLSYEASMNYMLSWNKPNDIITYWDEPTITLDYSEHSFHEIIQKNWSINLIPNVILSSATLPNENEIDTVIEDFEDRFKFTYNRRLIELKKNKKELEELLESLKQSSESSKPSDYNDYIDIYVSKIENIDIEINKLQQNIDTPTNVSVIKSYECKKTISIINKDGYVELPHLLFDTYKDLRNSVHHIRNNKTILRYLDLNEISKFIIWINRKKEMFDSSYHISNVFQTIEDVNMLNIKLNYLNILDSINNSLYKWTVIYNMFIGTRIYKFTPNPKGIESDNLTKAHSFDSKTSNNSNIFDFKRTISHDITSKHIKSSGLVNITTSDSYTLTDGPTIYIASDVDKIAKFCLHMAKIPANIMKEISDAITFNNTINNKLTKLEKDYEDAMAPFEEKEKRINKDTIPPAIKNMRNEINNLTKLIKSVTLPDVYIPNKIDHLNKWTNLSSSSSSSSSPYTSKIIDSDVEKVMAIKDVDDIWKVLLLLGIGLFSQSTSITYTELVKEFAINQKLYLIIADGDYIYGTNYQFCHGYLSKDLIKDLTQEKAIQAMGRIGRNKFQLDYTIRFRENNIIRKIFLPDEDKPEARNMCRLFSTDYSLLH